jgi:hypothetical protein
MVIDLNQKSVSSVRAAANSKNRITGYTHDFYNYPARFSPLLAREIILNYSEEGDMVLDPFMGGGTTLIESKLLNRMSVGFDISSLSSFLANVKSNPLRTSKFTFFDNWMNKTVEQLNCQSNFPRPYPWIEKGYQKNLNCRETWPLRKIIEQFLYELSLLKASNSEKNFLRCVILKTGQWALDSKKKIPSSDDFKQKLVENYLHMRSGSKDFWAEKPKARATIVNSPASEIHNHSGLFKIKPKLVLTSPPYPGVHVVYHRWQVFGKRETPAPFWIANSQDGHGLTHYAMGGRKQKGLIDYFENIKRSFESIKFVCDETTVIVQVLAFSEIDWQLPKYLETMQKAGYSEMASKENRIWREVPNRKWYATQKGKTSGSKEVILFHKIS